MEGETLLFPARPLFEVQNPHCLVLMCGVLKSICLFIVSILDDYGFKSTNHCCGLNPPNKSFVYSFGIEFIMGRHRVIIEWTLYPFYTVLEICIHTHIIYIYIYIYIYTCNFYQQTRNWLIILYILYTISNCHSCMFGVQPNVSFFPSGFGLTAGPPPRATESAPRSSSTAF